MPKRGVLLPLLLALLAALAGSAAASAATPRTISFLEVEQTQFDRFVDANHNQRPDPGDMFMSTSYLYRWHGSTPGARLGRAEILCILATQNNAHCTGTFLLPNGTVTGSSYVTFSNNRVTVPILGGTGAYAGARGVFTSKTIGGPDSNKSADEIHLLG
jgi:hypothetical protein